MTKRTQAELEQAVLNHQRKNTVVSRFQARTALHRARLLSQVQAMMDDPATDPEVVLAWQDATTFRRDSPTVTAMATGLGLTDSDLDALFDTAQTIEA